MTKDKDTEHTKLVTIRMPKSTWNWFKNKCTKREISINKGVLILIERFKKDIKLLDE